MPKSRRGLAAVALCVATALAGCSEEVIDTAPRTIEPAGPAASPKPGAAPAGEVLPLPGPADTALFDTAAAALVVFARGERADAPGTLRLLGRGATRTIALPAGVGAVTGDGRGTVYACGRGTVLTVDLAGGRVTSAPVPGHDGTVFTAIARRGDGRLVVGSATGAAYTLAPDLTVAAEADAFARVDAVVTRGDTAVVLDRGQTSVTELTDAGKAGLALRAGLGAAGIAVDPVGRVLVTDSRGGQLMVFGTDPLIERQAYPVPDAPYAVTGSATTTWVSLTASNTVVGYDLSTGIPVEKVRYPTVQQPNSLALDETSGTLYVVSGNGSGVQVIRDAAGGR